jgi:hypothetical protein
VLFAELQSNTARQQPADPPFHSGGREPSRLLDRGQGPRPAPKADFELRLRLEGWALGRKSVTLLGWRLGRLRLFDRFRDGL